MYFTCKCANPPAGRHGEPVLNFYNSAFFSSFNPFTTSQNHLISLRVFSASAGVYCWQEGQFKRDILYKNIVVEIEFFRNLPEESQELIRTITAKSRLPARNSGNTPLEDNISSLFH